MKFGMMLEVDETFTTIWLSSHPRSGSRSGDDLSPLSGLFLLSDAFWRAELHHCAKFGQNQSSRF